MPECFAAVIRYPFQYYSPTYTVGSLLVHCLFGVCWQVYNSMEVLMRMITMIMVMIILMSVIRIRMRMIGMIMIKKKNGNDNDNDSND